MLEKLQKKYNPRRKPISPKTNGNGKTLEKMRKYAENESYEKWHQTRIPWVFT